MDDTRIIEQTVSKFFVDDILNLSLLCLRADTDELSFDINEMVHVHIKFSDIESE